MLAKRIIACLDVCAGKVVKGIQFKGHQVVGDIVPLAEYYSDEGIDELVLYDITASSDRRRTDRHWIEAVARRITVPFTVAGGIASLEDARMILHAGADKISINSPALAQPARINALSREFGRQCITVGIDSKKMGEDYWVFQYTGDEKKIQRTAYKTVDWIQEVHDRGAGEIVLNCMGSDGVRHGYDIEQLQQMGAYCTVPLIASGGAGSIGHFQEVFQQTKVSGALAASVFHHKIISIAALKKTLAANNIEVRYEGTELV